jgi:hypothetical protein
LREKRREKRREMMRLDDNEQILFNTSEFTDEEILAAGGIAGDTCPDCDWGRIWGALGDGLELLNPSGEKDRCC